MSDRQKLIDEIQAFLAETGMAPSRLGIRALGDPGFVIGLQRGRKIFTHTAEKVRAFMIAYRAELTSTRPDPTRPPSTVSAV
jgi:hypothetical protein